MMKKLMSILLAVMLAAAMVFTAAAAEEENGVPQPTGGKKFESDWAIRGVLAQINYEEEGYRVHIESSIPDEQRGIVWEYSCLYNEEKDALVAVSASKYGYTVDPVTFEQTFAAHEYEGFVEEGKDVLFTIDENGMLNWQDGYENQGADLEFRNIGAFEGRWANEAEGVTVDISWNGLLDEERFYYTVYIQRGDEQAYTLFLMNGTYNTETCKLECSGTATSFTLAGNEYVAAEDDGESYDAFFSFTGDGKLLFEAANGIELEYLGLPSSEPIVSNG